MVLHIGIPLHFRLLLPQAELKQLKMSRITLVSFCKVCGVLSHVEICGWSKLRSTIKGRVLVLPTFSERVTCRLKQIVMIACIMVL